MSKKSVTLFCYDCDLEFTVKFSRDDSFHDPSHCPFCGDEIEVDQVDDDSDDSEETE